MRAMADQINVINRKLSESQKKIKEIRSVKRYFQLWNFAIKIPDSRI